MPDQPRAGKDEVDWTLIVVASRYRWPEAPPYWDEPSRGLSTVRFPLVRKDEMTRTAWYGAVLV